MSGRRFTEPENLASTKTTVGASSIPQRSKGVRGSGAASLEDRDALTRIADELAATRRLLERAVAVFERAGNGGERVETNGPRGQSGRRRKPPSSIDQQRAADAAQRLGLVLKR